MQQRIVPHDLRNAETVFTGLLNGDARRFKQPGKYSFSISQIMRDNPLLHIMSVGLRIEKKKD